MDYVNVASTIIKTPYNLYTTGKQLYKAGKYLYNNMPSLRKRKVNRNSRPSKKPRTGFKAVRQGGKRGAPGGQSTMQPSLGEGRISYGRTLSIGAYKPMSATDKILAVAHPPQTFNSKWTFQMDCGSGRVTAATIPVLNKTLIDPIYAQLFTNALTDTLAVDGQISADPNLQYNYSIKISDYRSKLQFYNSSSQHASCRLVWYKPKNNMTGTSTFPGGATCPSGPLNTLMLASTAIQPRITTGLVANFVGDGVTFDTVSAGSSYTVNFEHAGWPITGATTTVGTFNNNVAFLDPSLVPSSKQVRTMFNQYWTEESSEDFNLGPGHQHNSELRLRNRIVKTGSDDTANQYYKNSSIVGVLYVLGQIVFNDGSNSVDPTITYGLSTGSSQISILREDTCRMQPITTKKSYRLNLTNPYQVIQPAQQAEINTETGDVDNEYTADGF